MAYQSYEKLEPYSLFRKGYDTLDIANLLQMPEHEVLRVISMARSALRDQPYPYQPYSKPGVLVLPKGAYAEYGAGK